jgi:DNA repair protein RecO (recombination protein O)
MLTRDYGRVGLVYKGAKRSHKRWAQLQPFCRLQVSWSGKGELYALTGLEVAGPAALATPRLKICGLYLNELIMNLVPRGSPGEELFGCYEETLSAMSTGGEIEPWLRRFEFHLLKLSGYGPQLEHEAESDRELMPEAYYYYQNDKGPVLSPPDAVQEPSVLSGRTLLALKASQAQDAGLARESKQFLRDIIDYQLQGKTLRSREIMRYLERSRQTAPEDPR